MRVNKILDILIRVTTIFVVALSLTNCGRSDAYILEPQHWNEDEILVEIRPGAPRKGMNEFVVVATNYNTGVPGYQYIVSLRMNNDDQWQQMIQDGHSGVYRRAIAVQDPANGVLIVQLRHKKEQSKITELRFPLSRNVK